ncbi:MULTISPECIES: WG repeat-containing protein [Flavobacterium]|uniref:WG repeat-containing protein n=3 Tax=Flavobacterium covae TaxID=2906076 RepID=A0ABW8PJK2_9FLAO|nr:MULTISPECIES: WG repeat-containing protein [Flavobacterium]MCJ1806288.1 WG repeat-containing protein [Flavobacterium covae]
MRLLILIISFTSFCHAQTTKHYILFNNENYKMGLINENGKVVLDSKYDYIGERNGNFVVKKNEKYGVLNQSLKQIIPIIYQNIESENIVKGYLDIKMNFKPKRNNLYIASKNDKYGIINDQNQILIPFKYERIDKFQDGFIFTKNSKVGFIDKNLKIIIKEEFEDINRYANSPNNTWIVKVQDKWGLINEKLDFIIKPIYNSLEFNQKQNLLTYSLTDGKYGIMDINENILLDEIKCKFIKSENNYFRLYDDYNNLSISQIILKNDLTLKFELGDILKFSEISGNIDKELIAVQKNGKYGFINKDGKLIIPYQYDGAYSSIDTFSAPVLKDGKWGYINSKNEILIDFKFTGNMYPFENGIAEYYFNPNQSKQGYNWNKNGLIDLKGNIIAEPKYERIKFLIEDRAIILENGIHYLFDLKNKVKLFRLDPQEEDQLGR